MPLRRSPFAGGRRGKECELASHDWRRGAAGSPDPHELLREDPEELLLYAVVPTIGLVGPEAV
jgi:hypothetical protein